MDIHTQNIYMNFISVMSESKIFQYFGNMSHIRKFLPSRIRDESDWTVRR